MSAPGTRPTIYIVDDDPSLRKAVQRLLRSTGLDVEAFASAEHFLAGYSGRSGCLLLDVQLPGLNGLELQERLTLAGSQLPVVFITARDDVRIRTQALAAGAKGFLLKPFDDHALLSALQTALASAENP